MESCRSGASAVATAPLLLVSFFAIKVIVITAPSESIGPKSDFLRRGGLLKTLPMRTAATVVGQLCGALRFRAIRTITTLPIS